MRAIFEIILAIIFIVLSGNSVLKNMRMEMVSGGISSVEGLSKKLSGP